MKCKFRSNFHCQPRRPENSSEDANPVRRLIASRQAGARLSAASPFARSFVFEFTTLRPFLRPVTHQHTHTNPAVRWRSATSRRDAASIQSPCLAHVSNWRSRQVLAGGSVPFVFRSVFVPKSFPPLPRPTAPSRFSGGAGTAEGPDPGNRRLTEDARLEPSLLAIFCF